MWIKAALLLQSDPPDPGDALVMQNIMTSRSLQIQVKKIKRYFVIFCYSHTFFSGSSFEITCDSAQAFQTAPGVSSLIFSVRIPRLEGPETDQRCCKSRSRGMHSESHSSPGQEQCPINPEMIPGKSLSQRPFMNVMNTPSTLVHTLDT